MLDIRKEFAKVRTLPTAGIKINALTSSPISRLAAVLRWLLAFIVHRAMTECWWRIALGLWLVCVSPSVTFANARGDLFTNSFLVKFRREVDNQVAHSVADRNGFVNLGPVSNFFFSYFLIVLFHFILHNLTYFLLNMKNFPHFLDFPNSIINF